MDFFLPQAEKTAFYYPFHGMLQKMNMKKIIFYISGFILQLPRPGKALWSVMSVAMVSLLFIMFFSSNDVATFPVGWEKSFPITPYNLSAKNVKMAVKGNFIASALDGLSINGHPEDIRYARKYLC